MKIKALKFIIFGLAFAACLLPAAVIHASVFIDITVPTGCTKIPSYTALLKLNTKQYDAYVRLPRRGESAVVTGFIKTYSDTSGCQELPAKSVSGDHWTRIGTFTPTSDSIETIVELASPTLASVPSANRPEMLLLPHANPPCVPDTDCRVTVDGARGIVQPTGTMLNENSLHVLNVIDPHHDVLKKVNYYTDDRLVYTTPTLQPFDMRYAAYPDQTLTRVAQYASGQQIVFTQQTPEDFSDNFGNFVFRLSQQNPMIFYGIITFFVSFIIYFAVSFPLRRLQEMRNNEIRHGFAKRRQLPVAIQNTYYSIVSSRIFGYSKFLFLGLSVTFGVFLGIVWVNNYVVTMFKVDGESMQTSFFTGDQTLVNKIPITLAHLNGTEYIPKRGDVVIVRAVFGNVTTYDESSQNEYLIKRVLGLPGDRIVVKNGVLTVYNSDHPNGFQPDATGSWKSDMTPDAPNESLDVQLGASELFVSGDNRPSSLDSRFNGPLKTKEVVGIVVGKVWPLGKEQSTQQLLK